MSATPALLSRLLLQLRPHLRIAHRVPGRIRLKLGPGVLGTVSRESLVPTLSDLAHFRGIHEARLNLAALSAVVTYDPKVVPDGFWDSCLALPGPDLEALITRTLFRE